MSEFQEENQKEKGFRMILCKKCKTKIRGKISEKDYGKEKQITCPKCKTKHEVTILAPTNVSEKNRPINPTNENQKNIDSDFTDFIDFLFPKK